MGDPLAVSYSLPPGCNFFPSPRDLLEYYLSGKNNCNTQPADGYDFIKELDLYQFQPCDLPDMTCYQYGDQRHWYFYTLKGVNESGDGRRMAKSGHWKRVGGTVDVTDDRGQKVLGTRAEFRFYLGISPKTAIQTQWLMHEYALLQDVKASFVLCRVFDQPCVENSASKKNLSSCAEESVSEVRHVGIQHDGFLPPNVVDAKVQVDYSIDGGSNASGYPSRLNSELDDPAMTGPVSAASFESPIGFPLRELVTSQLTPQASSQLTPRLFFSILEEDFIELDDLLK